jgi:hypothetical protein
MSRYTADQIIVIDESASNERTADRRWLVAKGDALWSEDSSWKVKEVEYLACDGINEYLDYDISSLSDSITSFELR